jgi:hypothetical protein
MKLRVLHHGHIYSSYLDKSMESLLFDFEYVYPRQICYLLQKNRMDLARSLWNKLCSVLQVWDKDVDAGLTH